MDFQFLSSGRGANKRWVVLSPRRAKRPDVAHGSEPICPFCLGREKEEIEVYRIGGEVGDTSWQVRVIPNKFPFAPIHEIIIHSPDHHKNFSELPLSQVELIVQTYRQRFQTHKDHGHVVIFNNHGEMGGESLPHPHTQLTVVPFDVEISTPKLGKNDIDNPTEKALETIYYSLACPQASQWPDEVWVAPKRRGKYFSDATDEEITDLARIVQKLVIIFTDVYGHEFPFNFYIYPKEDWYLRFMPRVKSIGGFEITTGIFVNTKDPHETRELLREKMLNSE